MFYIVGQNLFQEKLDDLPSISTLANISDESHFISKIHAREKILQSPSIGKNRYLGQQLTLTDETLISLGAKDNGLLYTMTPTFTLAK